MLPWLWLSLFFLFVLVESMTMGLISVFFSVGALAAAAVAGLGGPLGLQCVVFFALSVIILFAFRPFCKQVLLKHNVPTNADRVIGKTALCTATINANEGFCTVLGERWSARTTDGTSVSPGTSVVVERIEGVKLIVSPFPQNQN